MTAPADAFAADRDYHYLQACVTSCETLASEVDNDRARRILTLLAARGRAVLAVIDAEPGLRAHLEHLPYNHAVALLAEMIRQAHGLTRTAARHEADGTVPLRRSNVELWAEAEALVGRCDELGAAAAQHPPRLRLDTVDGSHALSRRLTATRPLDQAADTIDAAASAANRLPHRDPTVAALTALAADLRQHAATLRTTTDNDWWTRYFDRSRRAAAAQRQRAAFTEPHDTETAASLRAYHGRVGACPHCSTPHDDVYAEPYGTDTTGTLWRCPLCQNTWTEQSAPARGVDLT